jgi:hypothetical protein
MKSVESILYGVVKIVWLDDEGEEVDFGSDSLRRRAERQAEILRLAS